MPGRSLCLIIGMDAFLRPARVAQWRAILDLAHLVVAHRPGWSAPRDGLLAELLAERGAADARELHTTPAGASASTPSRRSRSPRPTCAT